MCGNLACIAALLLGVDAGWERLPEGGMLYIIQIEPELLDTLRLGEPICSDIPSELADIRSYRIIVGTAKLPHETPLPQTESFELPGSSETEIEGLPLDLFEVPPIGPADRPTGSPGSFSLLEPPDTAPASSPGPIMPAADSQPIDMEPATMAAQSPTPPDAEPADSTLSDLSKQGSSGHDVQEDKSKRPWEWLSAALLALAASLGANVYQGWIFWGTRCRYRALVEEHAREATA